MQLSPPAALCQPALRGAIIHASLVTPGSAPGLTLPLVTAPGITAVASVPLWCVVLVAACLVFGRSTRKLPMPHAPCLGAGLLGECCCT